jgi:hypothetical protein
MGNVFDINRDSWTMPRIVVTFMVCGEIPMLVASNAFFSVTITVTPGSKARRPAILAAKNGLADALLGCSCV